MPKPYPKEFRDDVVRVARNRDEGITLEQVAADFGVHPMTLSKWIRQADVRPLDQELVSLLNVEVTLADLADDIAEIGYPGAR
ncbi:transposase [Nocardia amikacinitolerans]|uniref:transposase n=1 Tax=Nocardia amikacinitolerans TaxID=756689 RepID=UPI0020A54F4F|nr:transposase [Nocardia amikacinitolerans]MCP2289422.1 Transposase [Nocardia amikacinitolerans]